MHLSLLLFLQRGASQFNWILVSCFQVWTLGNVLKHRSGVQAPAALLKVVTPAPWKYSLRRSRNQKQNIGTPTLIVRPLFLSMSLLYILHTVLHTALYILYTFSPRATSVTCGHPQRAGYNRKTIMCNILINVTHNVKLWISQLLILTVSNDSWIGTG